MRRFERGITITGEGAVQWGTQHPNIAIRAWSAYGYLKKDLPGKWRPHLIGGYWALSGDNPRTTNKIEGWDPVFSRWAKWGDLYLYAAVPEEGVGYATNTRFSHVEVGVSPLTSLQLRATWYHQNAFHAFGGSSRIFGQGTSRGNLMQVRGDFTLSRTLSGHIVYEGFLPGDFYSHTSSGYFLRGELIFSYGGVIPLAGRTH